ncbi:MAG: Ig-like domain-containing protein [bacterium]
MAKKVTGPDTVAASVRVDPPIAPFRLGASAQLSATGLNAAGAPVAGVVTYSSDSPDIVQVSETGLMRAMHVGSAVVRARLGAFAQPITVVVLSGNPATIVKISGDNATASVQSPVAVPPSVTVRDSVGNPASGVVVIFAVRSGGGTVTGAAATSDANGVAVVGSWTMGATPGANTLVATAPSVPNDVSATFTATAVAIAPTQLGVTAGSTTGTAGIPFATAPVIEISNAAGTRVQSATLTVTVTSSGAGRVGGTTTVTAVNGVARFTNLIPFAAGNYTLTFSSPELDPATLAVVIAQGASLSTLPVSFVTTRGDYNPEGKLATIANSGVGGAISGLSVAAITYAAGDSSWLTAKLLSASTQADLLVEPHVALLQPGTHVAQVTIIGTNAVPVAIPVSITINPLPPVKMVLTNIQLDATRNGLFPVQPVIEFRDSLGLVAPQVKDSVTAYVSVGPGGLSGARTIAAVNGVATFTDLRLDTNGLFMLSFSTSAALPQVSSRQFNIVDPANIGFAQYPAFIATGVPLSPQPVVVLGNSNGQPYTLLATVKLTIKGVAGASGVLSGTTSLTSTNGVFTFTDLVLTGTPGDYTLIATDLFGGTIATAGTHLH